MRARVPTAAAVAFALCAARAPAQDIRPLLDEPEQHYFDFWPGTWHRLVDGRIDTTATRFVVAPGIHPGAWEETWRQRLDSGVVLNARGVRVWDKTERRWMYVWISDNGLFQVWEGRRVGREWYFYREFDIQGDRYLSRQAWLPAGPDRLVRVSERSSDGGKTWQPRFREEYHRARGPIGADDPASRADTLACHPTSDYREQDLQ